ncbi:MAG: DUF4260 family protein [Leptospirales bacterium]
MVYNIIHFRGFGIFLYLVGLLFATPYIALAGIIILAHSTLDRVFEYGLKFFKGFKYTHLSEL